MKKIIWIVFLAEILALIMAFALTSKASTVTTVENIIPKDNLTHQQRAWLGALEWCESRGNPEAVNPKDRDNTPSYGILQFKPGTLANYKQVYGIEGKLMDADTQEAVVEQMIIKGGINWKQQFSDCVKKLGKPPVINSKALTSGSKTNKI